MIRVMRGFFEVWGLHHAFYAIASSFCIIISETIAVNSFLVKTFDVFLIFYFDF